MQIVISKKLEKKLTTLQNQGISIHKFVNEAIENYLENNPYILGKNFFDKYGSGDGNL